MKANQNFNFVLLHFVCFLLLSDTESKASVQYFYYKAKHFQHFHYVYNLMRTCHERIEALGRINHPEICMVEDVIIKIGIVGFTEDKFNLLSKRRGKV